MLLIVLAWTCLCVAAGFMAGCWCSHRPARGEGAAKQEDEVEGPPEKPPRELPPGRRQKLEKVFHTDSDRTMIHSGPGCKGLRVQRHNLVARQACSICCPELCIG